MKYLIYVIAIIFLVGVNLGLFNNLQLFGQIPNLLLLFTLFAALEKKDYDFFFVAFICGIFLDFYSASFFGSFTISLLLLALCLHILANTLALFELNWKSLGLLLLAGLVLLDLFSWIYGFAAYQFNWAPNFIAFQSFVRAFPAIFIYNLLLLYPTFLFYNFVKKIIDNLSIRRRGVVR
jgi:hypothetical protein